MPDQDKDVHEKWKLLKLEYLDINIKLTKDTALIVLTSNVT